MATMDVLWDKMAILCRIVLNIGLPIILDRQIATLNLSKKGQNDHFKAKNWPHATLNLILLG